MSARPRILHVGPDPTADGGMPAVVRDLLSSPLAARYDMEAVATYRFGDRRGTLARFGLGLGRIARFCLGRGARLVHVHSAVRGSLYRKSVCVLLVRALRRPVVIHIHAGANDITDFAARLGPTATSAFSFALRRADRVLSVSRAGAERLADHFGLSDVVVVPHAAPSVEPGPPPSRAVPCVLYLGGFEDPAKGGDTFVAALDGLRELIAAAEAVLAGPGEPDAAQRMAIRAAGARWAGWLGPQAKAEALRAAAVVVLPSLSEGLPVALLEAMAHGRAIVATSVGGIPELLSDGQDARLVAPGDERALAGSIAGLLDDPAELDRLGAAARRRAERLNTDEVPGRLDDLYRGLLHADEVAGRLGGLWQDVLRRGHRARR